MFNRLGSTLSLVIGTVFLPVLPALAESVDTAWVRRYNGPDNYRDVATALVLDGSGNVYVTGHSACNAVGSPRDYATLKYDHNGDTCWVRRYNGPGDGNDRAYDIAIDISGNVYVTGASGGGSTAYDLLTIKYYPNGDTAWTRRHDGPLNLNDEAYAIAIDDYGNAYVTGHVVVYFDWEEHYMLSDYVTIKYCPNGDTAWVRRGGYGCGKAIEVDDSGNVYVCGDNKTMKYDANGNELWSGSWGGVDITVDGCRNVYVIGTSAKDYTTTKYHPDGDTAWVRRYDGPGNADDYGSAIVLDDCGNVYVTGSSPQDNIYPYNNDYATIKYYPNGDTGWVRRYDGATSQQDIARATAVDGSRNIYVTGYTNGWDHIRGDYGTIKYDSLGHEQWVETYGGPWGQESEACAITVDDSSNVYVTGWSWGGFEKYEDYATLKYVYAGTDVKDKTDDRERPSEFTLSQNYPNPFNQVTKIEFAVAKSGFASLNIYDILGRKVRTLVSEHLSSGYKSVLWDGKNDSGKDVASGIYFYRIKVQNPSSGEFGDFTETKKLVLLM